MTTQPEFWRHCSSCKKNILFRQKYYECSVSTCQGKRTGYVFCSIPCWERHLPGAKHRDAGAIEKVAPSLEAYLAAEAATQTVGSQTAAASSTPSTTVATSTTASSASMSQSSGARYIVPSRPSQTPSQTSSHSLTASSSEQDVLVVVSKLKSYIKDQSDMNTSGDVPDVLSQMIRLISDQAIQNARNDGRKTVMARDYAPILQKWIQRP